MIRATVVICLALAWVTALAGTTLYRWEDDQGRVHYSDTPRPDSTAVEVGEPATFRGVPVEQTPANATPAPADSVSEQTATYSQFAIGSPAPDQVLWNIATSLPVQIDLTPALRQGHRLEVRFNGTLVADWPPTATRHAIKNVFRGTHTVSATIVDAAGKEVAAARPVTFYVKQTSILN